MVEYKHGLSKGLVTGLIKIAHHAQPINLKHLDLTRNQWDNFQKLRYWNLVEKCGDLSGKGGIWKITALGKAFVLGEVAARRFVWTYRGTRTKYDGDEIFIFRIIEGYKFKPDYSEEAVPHK